MAVTADYLAGAPGLSGALANYNAGNTYGTQAKNMLGEARAAGIFDPTNRRLRQLIKRRALLNYNSGARATQAENALYGLNPAQSRASLVNQDIAGRGQLADQLTGADVSGLQSGQDFYRNLFTGGLDYERQRALQKQQQDAQTRGGIGSAIGTIGAGVVKHYLPF